MNLYHFRQSQLHEWLDNNPGHEHYNLLKTRIADVPKAFWLAGKVDDWDEEVELIVREARARNELPVFVPYFIPSRDNGGDAAGGAADDKAYLKWLNVFIDKIGDLKTYIIFEPDALPHIPKFPDCANQKKRITLIENALDKFNRNQNATVYLDAGHADWHTVDDIVALLEKFNPDSFDGFSLNVSNRRSTDKTVEYGNAISQRLGGKHFVIDTSRNGFWSPQWGPPYTPNDWQNLPGEKLGRQPTLQTNIPLCDAFLWIKSPGESDGDSYPPGAPKAGELWVERAVELAAP